MKIGKGTEKKEETKAFPHFTDVRFWKGLGLLTFCFGHEKGTT